MMGGMPELTHQEQLRIISRAWGKQHGYCFFPWIRGDADTKEERIRGYNEGPAFNWPADKEQILEHIASHTSDDLYWCPSLFERKRRRIEFAMDEHALWADLDEVNPADIEEFPPTVCWQTSPGRYQGIWLFSSGDLQGASWPGNENQKLTYYLGADASGWDSTQLLRLPGWGNHKPEYKEQYGKIVRGQLVWKNGRRYLPDDFQDLPDVPSAVEVEEVLEGEIDRVDRREVWARVRLKIRSDVRAFFSAKEASGDRSDVLWQIERELADAGCSVSEIVAVVRPLVWNKYEGRADELKRLITEASKAVAQRPDEVKEELLEEAEDYADPYDFWSTLDNAPKPEWLIRNIWTKATVGFIAGQPKSYKSWLMLDMALSLSSGSDFLNHFPIIEPGPVLLIEEEDGMSTLKDRRDKVWPGKHIDRLELDDKGELYWVPATQIDPKEKPPPIKAMIREGVVLTDPGWQVWLDEQLEAGYTRNGQDPIPYVMVLIDSLMMIAGEVEENRSQEMTGKLFKPLKQLAEKYDVAILVVHHMSKGGTDKRGGQRMLGSVANHAWAENSMYVSFAKGGDLHIEVESKAAPGGHFKLAGVRRKGWEPIVHSEMLSGDDDADDSADTSGSRTDAGNTGRGQSERAIAAMNRLGPGLQHSTRSIADEMELSKDGAYKQLARLNQQGKVNKMNGSGRSVYWKVITDE